MRMHECRQGDRFGTPGATTMMMGGRSGRGLGHGGWGEEWDRPGPPGRGPRRGRMFAPGELRLVLLKLIADQSRHGYELIKAIEEITGGRYAPSPGVVYPTLSLLLDEGRIEEVGDAAPRRAFAATAAGLAELEERGGEAGALLARLREHGEQAPHRHAPPIARAVGNLLAALRDRAAGGQLDRETVHQIADILDEAARRIERL